VQRCPLSFIGKFAARNGCSDTEDIELICYFVKRHRH